MLTRSLVPFLCLVLFSCPIWAQTADRGAVGESPGPWTFATVGVGEMLVPVPAGAAPSKPAPGVPKGQMQVPVTTALKGLGLKLGAQGEAGVAYDLDLCRIAGGWSNGKFLTAMNLMSRGEYPSTTGPVAFLSKETAGFQGTEPWKDQRSEPFGPLPELRYGGLYVHGAKTVLLWRLGETEILEMPSYEKRGELDVFSRTFTVAPSEKPLRIVACRLPGKPEGGNASGGAVILSTQQKGPAIERAGFAKFIQDGKVTVVTDFKLPEGAAWREVDGQLLAEIPAHPAPVTFRLLIGHGPEKMDILPALTAEPPLEDLPALCKGGPAHWPEPVVTKGELAKEKQPYVVDTITLPEKNPWGSPFFVGGLDFFPDGRAAVCTFHGDVFIVSGLDAGLEKVSWRRFASGLYHAMGLKVVNGEIYVTERAGITHLRDLNGDGEADFYEPFNWDVKVTKSFHEFVFDLQTDSQGNFLFAKAGPVKNGGRGFDEICEHHGCLFQVSPDGKKFSVFATGFRAPNGLGTGPNGEITTGDNEGTWTPACKINWIKPHGFYGVVDLAHTSPLPTDYDRPICWLPKRLDNSSGGQVWVPPGDRWGPWSNHLLHLSYGTCSLFGVMMEPVELPGAPECCAHIMQGGVVKFPVKFQSGISRARFNPADGQLYVTGLRGWQTTAVKNGCFQRVRYTEEEPAMPVSLSAREGGLELKFATPLNTQAAADPENWTLEMWTYLWSSAYGSPELSTLAEPEKPADKGKEGETQFTKAQLAKSEHDPLNVKSVKVGSDERTVFLEVPGLKPVMQMSIKYQLKTAAGQDLDGEVVNTIHVLPK